MATINDAKFVRELLASGGRYENDRPIIGVVEYRNKFNGQYAYGICWLEREIYGYLTSPDCVGTKVLWTEGGGLTEAGKKFMEAA